MSEFNYSLNLSQNHGFQWFSQCFEKTVILVKGYIFYCDVLYREQEFAKLLFQHLQCPADQHPDAQLQQLLLNINGSFSIVVQATDWLWAAVDRVRSMPLFYGFNNDNVLILSDDALWLREQVGDAEPDSLRTKEFLLTGYVTGSCTLFPRVKQLQAGEYLLYIRLDEKQDFSTYRYYRWLHGDYSDATEEELCAEMDLMHRRVFERLLASTKGSTIVVPLSGGYDSRLIVTMLKRLGKEDVICFSYGRPGNWESEISKSVSEKLGYPWLFVPYDRSRWRNWFASQECKRYSLKSSGLNSVAHIQDFAAVWELTRSKKIPQTAVFVPGHTGDFIAGGHLPHEWKDLRSPDFQLILFALKKKHYNLWSLEDQQFLDEFKAVVGSLFEDVPLDTVEDAASAYEYWEWQERQAKFIVNSVRVYEWWGFEWRLPLWDNDVMEYWRHIKLRHRIGKSLYDRYVRSIFEEWHINFEKPQEPRNFWARIARRQSFWNFFSISEKLSCYKFYLEILATSDPKNYSHVLYNVRVNTQLAYELLHRLRHEKLFFH
ncbi:MAG TPA: asparagine synthase-related protein [Syntrophales bacterium]|nr:asparagine synthase-related protein [Syntrophales bacterium]